jgi:hypothetical protein
MSENPLTNLYFFAHDHPSFNQFTVGQVGGCVAPGWFLVSVGVNKDTDLSDTCVLVSVDRMSGWVFLPTLDDVRQYKAAYKKQHAL